MEADRAKQKKETESEVNLIKKQLTQAADLLSRETKALKVSLAATIAAQQKLKEVEIKLEEEKR